MESVSTSELAIFTFILTMIGAGFVYTFYSTKRVVNRDDLDTVYSSIHRKADKEHTNTSIQMIREELATINAKQDRLLELLLKNK